MPLFRFALFAALCLPVGAGLLAQTPAETPPKSEALAVELNAAETVEGDCKLSFLITNRLPGPLDKAVFETVLFDRTGTVDRLTLFDFGALPQGRPRVRQFVVPQTSCEHLGQILFNGAQTCDGAGVAPGACAETLHLNSRTDIEVLG